MQARILQSQYDRGVIQDIPRHMLPSGSVWKMFDLIPDLGGAPLAKRGGWKATGSLVGATKMNAVAYSPFNNSDLYCAIDNRGHLWESPAGYLGSVLSLNPALHWRLGESLGSTTAGDASGHGNTGAYTGVTLVQPGAVSGDSDTAGAFSQASSSRVSAATYQPFVSGSKRTFMGWAYRSSTANTDVLFGTSVGSAPQPIELLINPAGEDVQFFTALSTSVTWAAAWPGVGQWVHWALTYDDTTKIAELFINGVSKGQRTLTGGYFNNYNFMAGSAAHVVSLSTHYASFTGNLDEITVFEYVLTAAQVTQIYSASSLWTDKGAAVITKQRPIFFNGKLIILPDGTSFTTPKKFDGTTISTLAMTGLTGVTPLWGATYKSRLVIADTTTLYFSNALDPETYDVDSFVKTTYPITGIAALPNMIAVFSSGHVERLRGGTPPSTTTAGDMSLEPAFTEGCIDARSIVVYRDQVIWANRNGVHISDGAAITNLVESGGIKEYWRSILSSYSLSWVIAAGIFRGQYVLSITDGTGGFVAAFLCDLAGKTWTFLNNLPVGMFSESQGATSELYMAVSNQNLVGSFSSCLDPASVATDGNGVAVQPSIEYPFFRGGTGSSRWRDLFLGVDLDNEGVQAADLELYYTTTPDSTAYVQVVDDAGNPVTIGGTAGQQRIRIPVQVAANGLGLKVVQVGASTKMALFDLEAVIRDREGRY